MATAARFGVRKADESWSSYLLRLILPESPKDDVEGAAIVPAIRTSATTFFFFAPSSAAPLVPPLFASSRNPPRTVPSACSISDGSSLSICASLETPRPSAAPVPRQRRRASIASGRRRWKAEKPSHSLRPLDGAVGGGPSVVSVRPKQRVLRSDTFTHRHDRHTRAAARQDEGTARSIVSTHRKSTRRDPNL